MISRWGEIGSWVREGKEDEHRMDSWMGGVMDR